MLSHAIDRCAMSVHTQSIMHAGCQPVCTLAQSTLGVRSCLFHFLYLHCRSPTTQFSRRSLKGAPAETRRLRDANTDATRYVESSKILNHADCLRPFGTAAGAPGGGAGGACCESSKLHAARVSAASSPAASPAPPAAPPELAANPPTNCHVSVVVLRTTEKAASPTASQERRVHTH